MYNKREMRVYFPFSKSPRGRRVLLSTLILAVSLGTSAYLVFNSPDGNGQAQDMLITQEAAGLIASQNLNFARAVPNLTDEFTERAVEKLIAENETLKASGETNSNNFTLLPGKTDVADIVSKLIDSELATEQIKTSELLTNKSNAKEVQLVYLFFVNEILEAQGKEMPDPVNHSLTAYFSDTAAKLDETAEILKVVKAPPSWLEIHRDLVAFYLQQRNIYRSLGAADTDPLRFMIAATRLLPSETEREFQKIQTKINQKIIDEKLI